MTCDLIILDGVPQKNVGNQITLGDDVKLIMSTDGLSYFIYDSITSKLQLFVNNVKRAEWR